MSAPRVGPRLVPWLVVLAPTAHAAPCAFEGALLTELLADAPGADAQAEWVEVLATGPAHLGGWRVERATRPGAWQVAFELPPGLFLRTGERVVVAGPAAEVPSGALVIPAGAELGNATTDADAVRLVDAGGCVVDLVAYGEAVDPQARFDDEWGDTIGADRLAPAPEPGLALARVPDTRDTGNSRLDLQLAAPTPGTPNPEPPPCALGTVAIDELHPDPVGEDSGREWLELAAEAPVEVGGWRVEAASTPDAWRVRAVLPAGAWVHDRLVVADVHAEVPEDALRLTADRLALGNGEDAVRLVDCTGTAVHTVVYGGANPEAFPGLDGVPLPESAVAPAVAAGRSLARDPDGRWHVAPPTPGAANGLPGCVQPGAEPWLSELQVHPDDADAAWVELGADAPADLGGWTLVAVPRPGVTTVLATLPEGATVRPDAPLVVGGLTAEVVDVIVEGFDPPNGTGVDALALVACDGREVDRVLYGGTNTDRVPDATGSIPESAPEVDDGACLTRRDDGWLATPRCTPGVPEAAPAGLGEVDDAPLGCARPEARRPGGGCDVGGGGAPVLLAALALSRRSAGRRPGSSRSSRRRRAGPRTRGPARRSSRGCRP